MGYRMECNGDADKILSDAKIRVVCPFGPMQVLSFEQKFFLVDDATNTIKRLTKGAFDHLREAWTRNFDFAL